MTDKSAEAPAPDLVKQLLFRSSDEDGIGWTPTTVVHVPAGLLHNAADELARLTAEVERLTKGRETMGNLWARERAARVAAEAEVGWLEAARAPEMADEITNLRAAISKLESELASALTDLNTARQDNASFGPEFKRLTAENERLRAALERIAADAESDADLNEWGAAAVALAALKEPRT